MEMPTNPAPASATTVYVPEPSGNKLFSRRNIILIFFLLVIVIALPVGVYLVQKTQIFKSKATDNIGTTFTFTADSMVGSAVGDTTGLRYTSTKSGLITMQIKPNANNANIEAFLPKADTTPTPTATPAPTATPVPAGGSAPTATPRPAGDPTPTATPIPASTPTATPTPVPASSKPGVTSSTSSTCSPDGSKFKLVLQWQPVDGAEFYYVNANNNNTYKIDRPNFGTTIPNLDKSVAESAWYVSACSGPGNCGEYKAGKTAQCQ